MRIFLLLTALTVGLMTGRATRAEEAKIFGGTQGPLSAYPGTFTPAKTGFHCYSINEGKCWDGKAWQAIYPSGPRRYAKPTTDTVACIAIMKASHDCWDGMNWYHLPQGTLMGAVAGVLSLEVGAFITAPLR